MKTWISRRRLIGALVVTALATTTACTSPSEPEAVGPASTTQALSTTSVSASETAPPVDTTSATMATIPDTTGPEPAPATIAGGVDRASLATAPDGAVLVQETPEVLRDRKLATSDLLSAPTGDGFEFRIDPLDGEPLARSTWREGCPTEPHDLRYVTVSFWGFDDKAHTGELIVAADQAESTVAVFRTLYDARFPIEEMRVVTTLDIEATPTGDSNNTSSYVCRAVTGGSRFSEHAYGLAIDINPFHNPYIKQDVVIPELASSYLDRSQSLPGMITPDDVVVSAFAFIGWSWGGNWRTIKDYQHFSLNNR